MSKVLKTALLVALMATMGGRAYASPVNIDFNLGPLNTITQQGAPGWVSVNGLEGQVRILTSVQSRHNTNTYPSNFLVGDPTDWISPLTNTNQPSCTTNTFPIGCVSPPGGYFAFLEPSAISDADPTCCGTSPNLYTSISQTFTADPLGATMQIWAFFDAFDNKFNSWNDDGFVRVIDVATNTAIGPTYIQTNASMICDQGSDLTRWPQNNAIYLPANCIQPFSGPMQYSLVGGAAYRIEAGIRNGNPGDNDNTVPAALGFDVKYTAKTCPPDCPPPVVPEPSTLLLIGSGIGIAFASYRRRSPKA